MTSSTSTTGYCSGSYRARRSGPTERLNAGHNDVRVGAAFLPGFLISTERSGLYFLNLSTAWLTWLVGVAHEQQLSHGLRDR